MHIVSDLLLYGSAAGVGLVKQRPIESGSCVNPPTIGKGPECTSTPKGLSISRSCKVRTSCKKYLKKVMQFQLYLKSHEIYESAQKVIQKIMKFD